MTGDKNLVKLDEEVFVSVFIGLHFLVELQIQIFLHFKEGQPLSNKPIIPKNAFY